MALKLRRRWIPIIQIGVFQLEFLHSNQDENDFNLVFQVERMM